MDVLTGVVSKLRNSVEISGGGNNSSVTTTYVTIFQINGKPVKIKSREAILLDENDHVEVAGKIRDGVFNAYAYINDTTGVKGNIGIGTHYFVGLISPIAGAFVIYNFSDPFFGAFPKIIGLFFIMVGLYMLYKGTQISNAYKLLLSGRQP